MVYEMNLENCTLFQTKLSDFPYSITDQSQKIDASFQASIIITRFNYITAANQICFHLGKHLRRAANLLMLMWEKKISSLVNKMPNAKP